MRIPRAANDHEISINMTPMIDVVFLLIIFFLVSSHLARRESHIPLSLPQAALGSGEAAQGNLLTITIDKQGAWQVAGRSVDLKGIEAACASHFSKQGPEGTIRVRGDREVPYDRLSPILKAAHQAGLSRISIAVIKESRS